MKPADFGSISTATLKPAELLDKFHNELEWQLSRQERTTENREQLDRLHNIHGSIADDCYDDEGNVIEDDDTVFAIEELTEALEEFSPDYGYFGAHEGDGADFGYWPAWDALTDDVECGEILAVDDTSEVSSDYSGYVLHTNDHGNATLYNATNGELSEIWGIV